MTNSWIRGIYTDALWLQKITTKYNIPLLKTTKKCNFAIIFSNHLYKPKLAEKLWLPIWQQKLVWLHYQKYSKYPIDWDIEYLYNKYRQYEYTNFIRWKHIEAKGMYIYMPAMDMPEYNKSQQRIWLNKFLKFFQE